MSTAEFQNFRISWNDGDDWRGGVKHDFERLSGGALHGGFTCLARAGDEKLISAW